MGCICYVTQACLDMPHGYRLIECGLCCCGAGGGITMHQDYIGLALLEHVAHSGEYTCGDVIQVLSLFHDVQVKIRRDLKYTEHLVQHLAVLPGYSHYCLKLIRMLLELLYQRGHLYGLGAGSED